LPEAAVRGATLFEAKCQGCHAGPNFSDGAYHTLGAPAGDDPGLRKISGLAEDDGKFRTPSLRNVELTRPYMHDGSAATLTAAIRRHETIVDGLDEAGIADLTAFLWQLTDRKFVADPRFSLPQKACGRRF